MTCNLPSQVREPLIQDLLAFWLDRREGDSHPRVGPRIGHSA